MNMNKIRFFLLNNTGNYLGHVGRRVIENLEWYERKGVKEALHVRLFLVKRNRRYSCAKFFEFRDKLIFGFLDERSEENLVSL
jgi:hypothetical protein